MWPVLEVDRRADDYHAIDAGHYMLASVLHFAHRAARTMTDESECDTVLFTHPETTLSAAYSAAPQGYTRQSRAAPIRRRGRCPFTLDQGVP